MPSQGQLIIGQPVHDYTEARMIFAALLKNIRKFVAHLPANDKQLDEVQIELPITYRGQQFAAVVRLEIEMEGRNGVFTPIPHSDPDTWAFIGFYLTGRYFGKILDARCPDGRHEPFVFDPQEIQAILDQIRQSWPEAQAMIYTVRY